MQCANAPGLDFQLNDDIAHALPQGPSVDGVVPYGTLLLDMWEGLPLSMTTPLGRFHISSGGGGDFEAFEGVMNHLKTKLGLTVVSAKPEIGLFDSGIYAVTRDP